MEALANQMAFLVEGLGIFVVGLISFALVTMLLLGIGQMFVGLFAYVIPRMGLKVMRDYRSGEMPLKQMFDEMINPPTTKVMLNSSEKIEGEYQRVPGSGIIPRR